MVEDTINVGGLVWRNRNSDGTWTPYKTAYHNRNILGPVAFSGGANTGAIIERGSNANGEFVRFADGTMICAFSYTETSGVATSDGAIFRNATLLTWTFPAVFLPSAPIVVAGQFFAVGAWASQRAASAVNCLYYWQTAVAATVSGTAQLSAIGRWR
jgi:hypothetical protein